MGYINPQTRSDLYQFLSKNGEGTGVINAIEDYSGAADRFFIKPPKGKVYRIERMIVTIRDTGSMDSGGYGNGSALTNGLRLVKENKDGEVYDYTGGQTIKTNAQWAGYCYDLSLLQFGLGDEFINIRWTFAKSGAPITLDSATDDQLSLIVNDNLSALTGHTFNMQGVIA
jgi:hypothetical protein